MIRQGPSGTTLEAAWKIPLVCLSQKLFSKKMSALISLPPQNSSGCCSHRVCFWAEVGVGCSVSQQLPIHQLAVRGNLEATVIRKDIKVGRKGMRNGIDHVAF